MGYLRIRSCAQDGWSSTPQHPRPMTRAAVRRFQDCTGDPHDAMVSESSLLRHAGQACGYKIGHTELLRLREHVKKTMGTKYDLRDYNDWLVEAGAVPLTVLQSAIERRLKEACRSNSPCELC
jgi:uncharacterized protein (DUF885 family)